MMFKRSKSKKAAKAAAAEAARQQERQESKVTNDLRLRQISILTELQALKQDLETISRQQSAPVPRKAYRQTQKQTKSGKIKPAKQAQKTSDPEEKLTPLAWSHELPVEERLQAVKNDEGARRFLELAFKEGFPSSEIKRCPDDYYDWSLEQRREFFGAHGIDNLCKSLVVRNTRLPDDVSLLSELVTICTRLISPSRNYRHLMSTLTIQPAAVTTW